MMHDTTRTLFDERVEVRQLAEGSKLRDDVTVVHVLIEFGLKVAHNIRTTHKFPAEVRETGGCRVHTSNADRSAVSIRRDALDTEQSLHMTHALGDDFLRRQGGLLSARNAVLQHPLNHGHLLRLLSESRTSLDLDSDVIKVSPYELGNSCQMWLRR